jgi:hypothetical protein
VRGPGRCLRHWPLDQRIDDGNAFALVSNQDRVEIDRRNLACRASNDLPEAYDRSTQWLDIERRFATDAREQRRYPQGEQSVANVVGAQRRLERLASLESIALAGAR